MGVIFRIGESALEGVQFFNYRGALLEFKDVQFLNWRRCCSRIRGGAVLELEGCFTN